MERYRVYWVQQVQWWTSRSFEWRAAHLTAFYIGGAVIIMGARFDELVSLKLNEIGDLAAGVFGPAAFLWLVLGYLQQGRELKLSSEALQLQAKELNESVLQQAEIARATNQTLKNYEQSLEPIFHFDFVNVEDDFVEGDHYINHNFVLHNTGALCEHVFVCAVNDDGTEEAVNRYPFVQKNGRISVAIVDIFKENTNLEVKVSYVKTSGASGTQIFDFEKIRSYDDAEWYINVDKRILRF